MSQWGPPAVSNLVDSGWAHVDLALEPTDDAGLPTDGLFRPQSRTHGTVSSPFGKSPIMLDLSCN